MSLRSYIWLAAALDSVPVACLMFFLFRNRLRFSKWLTLLCLTGMCCFIAWATFYTLQPGYTRGWGRLIYSVLALALSGGVYTMLFHTTVPQILFTMMVIKGYRDSVSLFVEVLRNVFQNEFFSRDGLMQYCALTGFMILGTLPFIGLFLEKCVRPLTEADDKLPFWHFLWAVPVSFYFLFRLGVSPGYLSPSSGAKGAFLLPFVWTAASFITYFVILRMLSRTVRNAHLAERLHISNVQISMQRELYESLRRTVEDTRRLRHDFRHHMAALKGYADKNDCAGVSRYLNSFLDDFFTEDPLCENYAVDAIARHYVTLAKKAGAEIQVAIDLPQNLAVLESDLCVVLGNLLENAVEACQRQIGGGRFIRIRAAIVGHSMIAITIQNSYTGDIRQSGEAFLSSKRDGEGIGISSVRAIAERYSGTVKFEYGNGLFRASVLLNP